MYINHKRHYLSKSICISAVIGLASLIINAIARLIFNLGNDEPDMLNDVVYIISVIVEIAVVLSILLVFHHSIKEVRNIISIVDDDTDEVAIIQRKNIPNHISTLRAEAILQLLEIWAAILFFVRIISVISNSQYKYFIQKLFDIIPMDSYENAVTFSGIYNSTHGFKYIGMFCALIIGIFVTAVFLKDRFLKWLSVAITALFIVAFSVFQMISFNTDIKVISIVWTSVIYHGLETVGLIVFSIYLARHYKGI